MAFTANWGHKPARGRAKFLAEIRDSKNRKWELYELYKIEQNGWADFRLCIRGRFKGPVNLVLGWNPELDRFAGGSAYQALTMVYPELYQQVCRILKEHGYIRRNWVETKSC